jgi:hypothetical protein
MPLCHFGIMDFYYGLISAQTSVASQPSLHQIDLKNHSSRQAVRITLKNGSTKEAVGQSLSQPQRVRQDGERLAARSNFRYRVTG